MGALITAVFAALLGASPGALPDAGAPILAAVSETGSVATGDSLRSTEHARRSLQQAEAMEESLRQRLGLDDGEVKGLVCSRSSLLQMSYADLVEPWISKLETRLGLSAVDLKQLVLSRPELVAASFEEIIEPSLAALQGRPLGLSDAELKQLTLSHPAVLDSSPRGADSTVQWSSLTSLQQRLSLSDAELMSLVLALPPLLSREYEAEVKPLLAGLEKTWNLKKATDLKKFVLKMPSALGIVYEEPKASKEPQWSVTRAGDQKKNADPFARGEDMRKKEGATLVIELAKVKGKKVTKVIGIDDFGVDPSAAAKLFSKKCACGAAAQKAKGSEPAFILIQGHADPKSLAPFVVERFPEQIGIKEVFILQPGKKKTRADKL